MTPQDREPFAQLLTDVLGFYDEETGEMTVRGTDVGDVEVRLTIVHELVHARLPHNYFIYFFVTVFAGSALAYNLAGLSRVALLAASGSLDAAHVGPAYFAVLPLMSFGEAFVNGMVMAMAVVYRPKWVMSFDDRLYLRGR